jgi:hypothetical protein
MLGEATQRLLQAKRDGSDEFPASVREPRKRGPDDKDSAASVDEP